MSRTLSPPLAPYFEGDILEHMKREANSPTKKEVTNEEVLEATINLTHEIRHIAQSLGIPPEKIIT